MTTPLPGDLIWDRNSADFNFQQKTSSQTGAIQVFVKPTFGPKTTPPAHTGMRRLTGDCCHSLPLHKSFTCSSHLVCRKRWSGRRWGRRSATKCQNFKISQKVPSNYKLGPPCKLKGIHFDFFAANVTQHIPLDVPRPSLHAGMPAGPWLAS